MKRFLLATAFAIGLSVSAAHATATYVRVEPPAPMREVVVTRPTPRHVWIPGYYRWSGAGYVWAPGYWAVPPRTRTTWVPGYWAHMPDGYVWMTGYWR